MIQFNCPACGKHLRAKDDDAGKKMRCATCKSVTPIPAAQNDEPGQIDVELIEVPHPEQETAQSASIAPVSSSIAFADTEACSLRSPATGRSNYYLPTILISLAWFLILVISGSFGMWFFLKDRSDKIRQAQDAEQEKKLAAEDRRRAIDHENNERLRKKIRQSHEENERQSAAFNAAALAGLQRSQDQEEQENQKKREKDEYLRRLGSLSRGEFQQANRALELVKARGQEEFDRNPPEIIRQAALIDPDLIASMQRSLAKKRKMEK